MLMIPLSGCKKDTPEGKSFRFPLSGEPRQLDPQVAADSASVAVVGSLFEALTRLDDAGKAQPAAAEWSVSADGTVYTFRLREAYWSTHKDTPWEEPQKVTAQDFLFGIQRTLMPSTGSVLAEQLYGIRGARDVHEGKAPLSQLGVRALDDSTLEITLTAPDSRFPETAAGTPFMPCNEAFFDSTGGRYGLEVATVLGNGPFFLDRWNHGQNLLLRKQESYHGAADILPAAVRYVMEEAQDPVATLEGGGLDAAPLLPGQLAAAGEKGIHIVELDDTIQYIWLNNSVQALSSAGVRRALRDGLEWEAVLAQTDPDHTVPATGFAAPAATAPDGEAYLCEDNARRPADRRKEAKGEMEAALQAMEKDALPRMTLLCADDDASIRLARYVIQSWQKNLSLYCGMQELPADQLTARVAAGNYQIAISAATAPGEKAVDAFAAFSGTAAKGNLARFSSEAYDALLTQAGSNPDRTLLDRLEQKLVEECPSIPLCFVTRYFGVGGTVSGVIIRPFGGGSYGSEIDFRRAGKLDD